MNVSLTDDTAAIILLCGRFGKGHTEKPLSLTEYSSLVRWLMQEDLRPSILLKQEHIARASDATGLDRGRLESLLGRGVQLGFAVEEWQRNGIWIISRSDADYPNRYKKHLKSKAPPLLFGVGDRKLLRAGGLGMVGSRNVDQAGETFARQVAELCAKNGLPVVSGGARGVDQISMTAALEAGGFSIGVLAENLLKKSVHRDARQAISDGRLLLISPFHPNAPFTVGNAMSRNKLIYALSDFGLVVSADYKKGGTWSGAEEELKREHARPVFVRVGNDAPKGNHKLLELGGISWPESIDRKNLKRQLSDLALQSRSNIQPREPSLFDVMQTPEPAAEKAQPPATESEQGVSEPGGSQTGNQRRPRSAYQLVLPEIMTYLEEPATAEELAEALDVNKNQLHAWLKQAVSEQKIIKRQKPVRYEKAKLQKQNPSM